MQIHIASLPCDRVPSYCTNTEPHPAHDFRPVGVRHQGWHCYGIGTYGWDEATACQNNPGSTR